ncbi:MAG: helix-turn-helix domain-containing protein, partial [Calditrichota bacterium]
MAEDAKNRILEAAFEEFALKGRAGARMQAIADRAGINKAMLNYYFISKSQLYAEVIKEKIDEYSNYVLSKVENITDPHEFFRTFTQAHNIVLQSHPKWIRLLMLNYLDG